MMDDIEYIKPRSDTISDTACTPCKQFTPNNPAIEGISESGRGRAIPGVGCLFTKAAPVPGLVSKETLTYSYTHCVSLLGLE